MIWHRPLSNPEQFTEFADRFTLVWPVCFECVDILTFIIWFLQQGVSHFGRLHNVWYRVRRGSKEQEEEDAFRLIYYDYVVC